MSLHQTINDKLATIAAQFTNEVIGAIRNASIEDLILESHAAPRTRHRGLNGVVAKEGARARPAHKAHGRLARRSPEDISKALTSIVNVLKSQPKGLRSEEIRAKLSLDRREVPRILKQGLETKKLKSKGQKRATTYFAA